MKKTTTYKSYVFPYLDSVKIVYFFAQYKFLTFFIISDAEYFNF